MSEAKTYEQFMQVDQKYADLDSHQTIKIMGLNYLMAEPQFLAALLARAQRQMRDKGLMEVHCSAARKCGWFEATVVCWDDSDKDHAFTFGVIQRSPDAEVEFHS
jgi:hypothetical protein